MTLSVILSLLAVLIFGAAAIILSAKEEKLKKTIEDREKKQKQKIYEVSILKEIQDRIGYELDIERVIDVLTGSLKNLFPYSTTSSLFIKNGQITLKTYVEEGVSPNFIAEVKKKMLASFAVLSEEPLDKIAEQTSGVVLDIKNNLLPNSFFQIPLTVGNKVEGLINISSTKQGLYKEDEMTILYQIANQASNALSRLQEVLKTEKGKLTAMIRSLADGIFMIDTTNQLLVINESAKEMLNIQNPNPTIFDVLASLPKEVNFSDKIKNSISQNLTFEEKEVAIGERIVQVFITPVLTSEEKKVLGTSVLLHDITLEKNLSKMKEEFTNMVVHELRAPLAAIKGATEILSEEHQGKSEQETKLLNIINEQSKRLLAEVSSILDAAKIEAGKFSIQKTETDLSKLISERIEFFMSQAKSKNIILSAAVENNLPKVQIDPERISQVINNLVSNSLKFTQEGGKITLSVSKKEDKLLISVSDTGIGIPKEKQDILFSKFSQVENHPLGMPPTSIPGTGLGLYIVKGIVEAHGGSIELNSEVGKGTTITVSLPIEISETAKKELPSAEFFGSFN